MKRIVILTGVELRHEFFRIAVAAADDIEVVRTYCEDLENTLHSIAREKDPNDKDSTIELEHLAQRSDYERDFFESFLALTPDKSKPKYIKRGQVSNYANEIKKLSPDLLVAYGCSLVKDELLDVFCGRFLNVHLGLSPWYRGGGTNFWPLVNGEPEYVGATFMHIDKGVDTGEIIHQIRARVYLRDNSHKIGNRLISDMTRNYIDLIKGFEDIKRQAQPVLDGDGYLYRRKDYSAAAVNKMYENFSAGMIEKYLDEYSERCKKVPLVTQEFLGY